MKNKVIDEKSILKDMEPLSKALQKSAGQIWKMFVMRYVAKGVGEVFLALALLATAHGYYGYNKQVMIGAFIIAAILIFDSIQILINPSYFAMNDVSVRLKAEGFSIKR